MIERTDAKGQKIAVIEEGPGNASSMLMLHGGPGYYWLPSEIADLSKNLSDNGRALKISAIQGRGCGLGDYISQNDDLTDDGLYKRAQDLKGFKAPDVLLGHSTGAMVALTAVMEGFIKPKNLLLLSPYTASLGEHHFWVTEKAQKYPAAFKRFKNFVENKWHLYKTELPRNYTENLYIHWGELFFALSDDEKIQANLHYLDFHVIDSVPHVGHEENEPYTQYKVMLENFSLLEDPLKQALLRIGTVNAHWWKSNFQQGYPFIEKLKQFSFEMPIHILSGALDEITPPETVSRLASILNIQPVFADRSYHLPESKMPGELKKNLEAFLLGSKIAF